METPLQRIEKEAATEGSNYTYDSKLEFTAGTSYKRGAIAAHNKAIEDVISEVDFRRQFYSTTSNRYAELSYFKSFLSKLKITL
jgi:hypothetical protein